MRTARVLLCGALALAGAAGVSQAAEANAPFRITIQEEEGVPRRAEPVAVSLPFAEGALAEPEVALTDAAGRPIETQFEVLSRWGDGSIRWLLARCFADVPAHGTVTLTASAGGSSASTRPPIAAEKSGAVVVDTGALRAEVGPNAVDSFLASDPAGNPLLARPPTLVVYTGDGETHRCRPPDSVELEVAGPLYASALAAGAMAPAQGEQVFRYETRLHFWRGKAEVLAEHTLVSVAGPEVTIVDGIVVELQAGGLDRAVMGGAPSRHEIALPAAGPARLAQTCAFWQECLPVHPPGTMVLEDDFSYRIEAQDALLARGERAPGWLWAADGRRSLGIAVRDFWEEGPRALALRRDGRIEIECYQHWQPQPGEERPKREPIPDFGADPRVDEWFSAEGEEIVKRFLADTGWEGPVRRGPLRFGRTRAKTTQVRYLFGRADRSEAETAALAAQRKPLVPVVDPDYLCGTRALNLVWHSARESGLPVFEQALVGAFRNFERDFIVYGFLHFGDNQCAFGYNRTIPSTVDVTEYDTIRCLLVQFCRTGIVDYFRRADQAARHYADVDQDQLTGAVRFHGYRPRGEYHEEPRAYDMGGHIYIEGIVDHYALTGDRRSRRSFLRVGDYLQEAGPKDPREAVLTTDERSLTRPALAMLAIYDLTRDPKYVGLPRRMVEGFNAAAGDLLTEMMGQDPFRTWWLHYGDFVNHVEELLVRYHQTTGDPATLPTLLKSLDLHLRNNWDFERHGIRRPDNMFFDRPLGPKFPAPADHWMGENAMHFAYAAQVTGDNRYLAPFLDMLDTFGQGWEVRAGNRAFTRSQLWSVPFISLLPRDWRQMRDETVLHEAFRARLTQAGDLVAWSEAGDVRPEIHGDALWTDGPAGPTLRTHGTSWVSYQAPADILLFPGALSVWVKKEPSTWGRKPWPWYSEVRGLVHIAGAQHETNALDLMVCMGKVWARLYDTRGWEIAAPAAPSPWDDEQWHHLAVVWNRYSLTLYIDGEQAARDETSHLPAGGQQTIHLGWRPGNWYGQAGFSDLRLFRTPLSPDRVRRLFEAGPAAQ